MGFYIIKRVELVGLLSTTILAAGCSGYEHSSKMEGGAERNEEYEKLKSEFVTDRKLGYKKHCLPSKREQLRGMLGIAGFVVSGFEDGIPEFPIARCKKTGVDENSVTADAAARRSLNFDNRLRVVDDRLCSPVYGYDSLLRALSNRKAYDDRPPYGLLKQRLINSLLPSIYTNDDHLWKEKLNSATGFVERVFSENVWSDMEPQLKGKCSTVVDGRYIFGVTQDLNLVVYPSDRLNAPSTVEEAEQLSENDLQSWIFQKVCKELFAINFGYEYENWQWSEMRTHNFLKGGENLLLAGEMDISEGRIEAINNQSGHYYPMLMNLFWGVELMTQKMPEVFTKNFRVQYYTQEINNGNGPVTECITWEDFKKRELWKFSLSSYKKDKRNENAHPYNIFLVKKFSNKWREEIKKSSSDEELYALKYRLVEPWCGKQSKERKKELAVHAIASFLEGRVKETFDRIVSVKFFQDKWVAPKVVARCSNFEIIPTKGPHIEINEAYIKVFTFALENADGLLLDNLVDLLKDKGGLNNMLSTCLKEMEEYCFKDEDGLLSYIKKMENVLFPQYDAGSRDQAYEKRKALVLRTCNEIIQKLQDMA